MKTILPLTTVLFFSAAPAFAWPFTVRPLPAGFNGATVGAFSVGLADDRYDERPVAVDFLKNGRLQWYAGGTVISRYPESSSVITLPVITLPVWPAATVSPMAGTACDVDGDGDMDIVRANKWNGHSFYYTLQVFLNNGTGGFSTGYRRDWEENLPYDEREHYLQIVPGDFDGDGFTDLAIATRYENWEGGLGLGNTAPVWHGRLSINWNDGAGGFDAWTAVASSGYMPHSRVSTADVDRDGDTDLICDRHETWNEDDIYTNTTRLYVSNGDRTFTTVTRHATTPAFFTDTNRDGWPDVSNNAYTSLNNLSGGLPTPFYNEGTLASYDSFTIADVTDDGIPDLIFGDTTRILCRPGDGGGGFPGTTLTLATPGGRPVSIGAADADADGDTDLLVGLANGTYVFLENSALHFLPGVSYRSELSLAGVTGLHTADFDRDGREDLLAVTPSQEKLWFAFGEADGIPAAPVFRWTQSEAPHSAAVADFDNDGRTDVAYSLPSTGEVRLSRNTGASPLPWPDTALATGLAGVSHLTLGRYSGSLRRTDLLTGNATTGRLRWLYQHSLGWLGRDVISTFDPVPGAILSAEMSNGQGEEPFLVGSSDSTIYLRGYQLTSSSYGSAGTLNQPVTYGPHAARMVRADANRDGKDEIVYIGGNGRLSVWDPVAGTGYTIGATLGRLRDFVAVDWDRNGHTDFLCATAVGLVLWRYDASAGVWKDTDLYVPTQPSGAFVGGYTSLTIMDLNKDRWPDAVAADTTRGVVHYFHNAPRILNAAVANAPHVKLPAGGQNTAISFTATNAGRTSNALTAVPDVSCAFTGAWLQFQKAVPSGSSWAPGAALTQSELSATVSSVSFLGNGTLIGSSGPSAILSDGRMPVNYHSTLGNLYPMHPGASGQHTIRFTVTPGAYLSGPTRFYVRLLSLSGASLNYLSTPAPGVGWPAQITGPQPVLVEIVPAYTSLQQWRVDNFGTPNATGSAANDADPDRDGVSNLVEYFTGTSPVFASGTLNTALGLTVFPGTTPQAPVNLRVYATTRALDDPKLRVTIQTATSSLGTWTNLATRTGGGSWAGLAPADLPPVNGVANLFFTTTRTRQTTPRFFARLKLEELP